MSWESQRRSQRSDSVNRLAVCLPPPLLGIYPCFLPSGGFLRTETHIGDSEATCMEFTAWSRIEQTQIQRLNRTCSCCLNSHPFQQTPAVLGNDLQQVWVSLLNEFSIFSQGSFRAAGKHLPILSALTHSVFTRCPELDPITETKILSDSKVVNLTPTNMTSCHMDFMIILVEFHVSSIQGIPTYWRNWKLLHAVFINIGSWKNKRKKGKDSLYKSKWEFLFHLLDWWKIKCWMISTADGDGKKVFL